MLQAALMPVPRIRQAGLILTLTLSALVGGCAHSPDFLARSGPARQAVGELAVPPADGASAAAPRIPVVPITPALAQSLRQATARRSFAAEFASDPAVRPAVIGRGDTVAVTVWEAPPALLFGATAGSLPSSESAAPARDSTVRGTVVAQAMVNAQGTLRVPFVGDLPVVGQTVEQVADRIERVLRPKAHQPQVQVTITQNANDYATLIGEVGNPVRMALTPRGERLLDAYAASGGAKVAVNRITVQLTRGERIGSMSLNEVIQDPAQNIRLRPGDIVTLLHQPYSFTALGSTGRNDEIAFEAQGISLAQALARAGGASDQRADAKGVFVFRLRDDETGAPRPIVYQADLTDPVTFFSAQNFPIRHGDVLYIANAPAAELQKFLSILSSVVFTARGFGVLN